MEVMSPVVAVTASIPSRNAKADTESMPNVGTPYPIGRQYYEACWRKLHSSEAHAGEPYEDLLWANCNSVIKRAMFEAGMLFAGEPENGDDVEAIELKRVCPDFWQAGALLKHTLDRIQTSGGPSTWDKLTPAEWMVGRAVKELWPKCEAERLKQGYPKIVEIKPGEFDCGEKCTPCEAHERRKEEQKKAGEGEHKRFCQIEEKRWKAVLPTQVEVRDLRVDPEWLGNGYWVRGVAKNNSVSEISAIELTVVAHDCPTRGAPQSQCNLIERRRQRTWVRYSPR